MSSEVFIHRSNPANTPRFSYTGEYRCYEFGGFHIEFLTSGVFTLYNRIRVDLFLVGGGESGLITGYGGCGGACKTYKSQVIDPGVYNIVIGAGGEPTYWMDRLYHGATGGTTSAFGLNAAGGSTVYTLDSGDYSKHWAYSLMYSNGVSYQSKESVDAFKSNTPGHVYMHQYSYGSAGGIPWVYTDSHLSPRADSGYAGGVDGGTIGTERAATGHMVSCMSTTRAFGESKYPAFASGGQGGCLMQNKGIVQITDGSSGYLQCYLAENIDSKDDCSASVSALSQANGAASGFGAYHDGYGYMVAPADAIPNTGNGGGGWVGIVSDNQAPAMDNGWEKTKHSSDESDYDSSYPYELAFTAANWDQFYVGTTGNAMKPGKGGSGIVIMRSVVNS